MNALWLKQVRGVLGLEMRKTLFSGRAFPLYLLSLLPVLLITLFVIIHHLLGDDSEIPGLNSYSLFYAVVYQFILRFLLFVGCVWTFMNLFRGEIIDRSLHYYFLAPIRREVLVAGKFVSGFVATSLFFTGSALLTLFLAYCAHGVGAAIGFVFSAQGIGHMLGYASVTVLACLGYGAVFLVVGLFFKNPVVPGAIIWVLEGANPFMPALLKKISVIFYLDSMLPVKLPNGPFAIIADPVPVWLAVPGFLIFTAVTLFVAALKIRQYEISYAGD